MAEVYVYTVPVNAPVYMVIIDTLYGRWVWCAHVAISSEAISC